MAEKSGWILKGVSTRYCVLFGSFPELSWEQIPLALGMAMTAALPGTPFALKDTTAALASCGVNDVPRTLPEKVAVPCAVPDEEPPQDATIAAETRITTRRTVPPPQRLCCSAPWMRKATSDGPE